MCARVPRFAFIRSVCAREARVDSDGDPLVTTPLIPARNFRTTTGGGCISPIERRSSERKDIPSDPVARLRRNFVYQDDLGDGTPPASQPASQPRFQGEIYTGTPAVTVDYFKPSNSASQRGDDALTLLKSPPSRGYRAALKCPTVRAQERERGGF